MLSWLRQGAQLEKLMKYIVNHTCGHTTEIDLVGKTTERERRLAWLATQPCMDCKRAAEAAKAQATAEAAGLPALTGSDKQIAWAETIRAKALAAIDEITAKCGESAKVPEALAIVDWVRGQSESRWWIDHRDDGAVYLLRAAREAIAN